MGSDPILGFWSLIECNMLTAYPPIQPYAYHRLTVSSLHDLYLEEAGNPDGVPVVVLHGGPGAGCNEDQRRLFDPSFYRIVLFDQRGAGRSTPHGEIKENDTQALIGDIEKIRHFLRIERWLVYGASWGSTLALAYAQMHPAHVLGLIVRSVFLARPKDISWLYAPQGGKRLFIDHWDEFTSILPATQRHDPLAGYYALLTGPNEVLQMNAAKHWSKWGCYFLTMKSLPTFQPMADHGTLAHAKIECHYMANHCFLAPNQLLANMSKIHHLPGIILHGRYDLACPLDNAWELHRAWSNSTLTIVPAAGHSSGDPGFLSAIIRATQTMQARLL